MKWPFMLKSSVDEYIVEQTATAKAEVKKEDKKFYEAIIKALNKEHSLEIEEKNKKILEYRKQYNNYKENLFNVASVAEKLSFDDEFIEKKIGRIEAILYKAKGEMKDELSSLKTWRNSIEAKSESGMNFFLSKEHKI